MSKFTLHGVPICLSYPPPSHGDLETCRVVSCTVPAWDWLLSKPHSKLLETHSKPTTIWPTKRLLWVQLGSFLRPAVTLYWGSIHLFICCVSCGLVPSDPFEFHQESWTCPVTVLCPGQLGHSARESAGLCGWAALGLESSRSYTWSVPCLECCVGLGRWRVPPWSRSMSVRGLHCWSLSSWLRDKGGQKSSLQEGTLSRDILIRGRTTCHVKETLH